MPCYSGAPEGPSYSDLKEVKDELDLVTRLLCALTSDLDLKTIDDPELKNWIKKHREFDKKRNKK